MHGFGNVCFVAETGTKKNLALEIQRGIVEVAGEMRMLDEAVEWSFEVIRGTETREVDEVDGALALVNTESESEDYETGESEHTDEIVVVVKKPELV